MVAIVGFAPGFVPPVPLRLEEATFSNTFDRASLTPGAPLGPQAPAPDDAEALYVLVDIFATELRSSVGVTRLEPLGATRAHVT